MELLSPLRQVGQIMLEVRAPQPRPAQTTRVPQSDAAGNTGLDHKPTSRQHENAGLMAQASDRANERASEQASEQIRERHGTGERPTRLAPDDPDPPTGPPPAFDISILEVERDLQRVLARLQAERDIAQDAPAIRATPDAPDAPEAARPAPATPATPAPGASTTAPPPADAPAPATAPADPPPARPDATARPNSPEPPGKAPAD